MSCDCDHSILEIIMRDVVESEQVLAPCVVEIVGTGPQGPMGGGITPLPSRPTTLNEVIAGGVTLGLWP